MNIEKFIENELQYFEPMKQRAKKARPEIRDAWRRETVSERSERVSLETYEMCNGVVK